MALQTSFSPSSSSSSSCSFSSSSFSYAWKYHVFLSFRGPDSRHGFIGHLHKALSDKGIRTFIDDEELQKGEEITPSLAEAIEQSRIAIPVFSENYASSAFCLDELVKIMECVKGKGRLVLPVFYKVDPCNVRHQRGSYKEALTKHENRFKDDKGKVQRWREALHQAANLSGEHYNLGNEYERDFIVKIVNEISKRISRVPLHVADYPIGLQSRVLELNELLIDGSDDGVHMVGIYGIGGIGKTTLAKAVYNSVADQFESLCFIENMSELSNRHGLVYFQQMVLSKILRDKVCNLGSVGEGIPIIKERLRCKKALLVLDNVDKYEQLQAIIGGLSELGSGSIVIITTRDKHLLTTHGVKKAYEVGVLNEEEAVELFSWKAFKFEKVKPCYMDILKKLVTYASGLPLALELIGSSLFGKCVEEWISALDVYKKIPHGDVQMKLKVSFDALHPQEKNIFLDIACCFKGYELTEVKHILHAHYDVDPTYTIRVLVDKSLIKINNGIHDVITLHDLIQDMGMEIVRSESPNEPGARSRLWLAKDIIEVLQGDKGSSKIEVINLGCDYNGDVIEWDGQGFRKMENLRTLIIRKCQFSQGPKHLPNSLRILIWEAYSAEESLPSCFTPKHLVRLELPRNCFDSVQLAALMEKKFENMRVLNFDGCQRITKIPDLSSAPKLEKLSFQFCHNLTEIDKSVGRLNKLKSLNAICCSQLRSLPPLMLPSLEKLLLFGCQSFESFPEILGKMESLTNIVLVCDPTKKLPILKFPYSIHNLTGLQSFLVLNCGIVELPSSITLLDVKKLKFDGCEGLLLPNEDEGEEQVSSMSFSNKTELDIENCNISEEFLRIAIRKYHRLESLRLKRGNFRILPKCVEELQFLRELHLFDCNELKEIRGIPPNIEELFVVGCRSLSLLTIECIEEFQFFRKLHLIDCKKLKEMQGIPPNIEELHVSNCRSLSSWTREMLLNKKLYEEGQDKTFILPGKRLPVWFEYQTRESSITFWFRNKFPAISFGVLTPSTLFRCYVRGTLTINGTELFDFDTNEYTDYTRPVRHGRIFIFNKTQTTFRDQVDEALSENEWNRVELSVNRRRWSGQKDFGVGIHIIKERSSKDDIRFTDPLPSTFNDSVNGNSNPKWMSSTTTTLNVQDRAALNPVESLDVYGSSNSDSDSEPQSLVGSDVEQHLDDVYSNSDSEQSASAIQGTNGLPKKCIVLFLCLLLIVASLFGSAKWHWCFHHNEILTGTSLQEHQRLISINQHNLEGCESVNKAKKGKGMVELTCNGNAAEDDGKKPITENLSTTKAVSGSYESSFHSENVDQLVNPLMEIQAPSPQPLDPLAELERVLQGSDDLPPESTSPTAASSSDIQASEVVIILQNLEPLLDNPLESLIADGEIKHQILDCLSKLGLLEDHIPIPLQSIVAQVRDFYGDLIQNFPSIQQTLVDYSCLEETRSEFLENLNQAKAKQAQIDAEVLRGKVQVEELDTATADLEIKLKAAVEKRNELKLAIKNGEAEKNKLLKDASAWLMESKQVVKKIKSSEHAYRDAQNSKARLEGRLAMLKGAFAANKKKR